MPTTPNTSHDAQPMALPAPWVTTLTCPSCSTPGAMLVFDGVGTICRECGDTTCALIGDETEDA